MQAGEWFDDSEYEDFEQYEDTKSVQLRDWQREAKKFFFDNNGTAVFEVVTGAGKTFNAIDIIQDLLVDEPNLRILIVVPKNVILETGWYKELVNAGFPIQNIGVYYGNIKEYAQITLTNMQNIDKVALDTFDMGVFDETHNYATKRMLQYLGHPFKYKLGLTATLKRQDNKHHNILKVFDYKKFEYKPEQALSDGVLNPFDFLNVGVQLDARTRMEYDDLTQQLNTIFQTGGGFERIMRTNSPLKMQMLTLLNQRKMLINNFEEKFYIVRDILHKHKHNKIIIFNQFNQQTTKLYWYLMEDEMKCRVVHSDVQHDVREKNLIDFKHDKFNVLLTTKVLDEGYDLPKLDVAIIMAGDTTDKQTVQRMGRVLRKKQGGNSKLYQIYCMDTMEERAAHERAKMFKSLSSDYKETQYFGPQTIEEL